MFNFLTDPLSRLKYGFIPTLRIVEDDEIDVNKVREDSSIEVSDNEPELQLEYRDEKGRKWWKFFDEYEYRSNKQTRSRHKWYKWFNETDTPAERKLILKLDLLLTVFAMAAYWVKYLDQTNLNNAYVTSMKDDIGMKGNDLVHTQVMFNVGNIIFQLPFIYLLNAAPLNFLLPAFDILWSIVTICLYRTTNVPTLKALRFLIGVFEAQAYYSYHFLLGSWFTVDEISRRAMVFYFGQYLGVLTSGLLSGAIVRSLNFVNGLKSWQWIFIIDGLISLGIGIIGIYAIPGTPRKCYSIFLSDEEIRLARRRLLKHKIDANDESHGNYSYKQLLDLNLWKSIFTGWEFYILTWWNIFCWNNSNGASGAYVLWLKSLTKKQDGVEVARYGAGELQDKTALTPGLGILWLTIVCSFADLFHSRWGAIIFSQVFNVLGNILLAVWYIPERAKWFAWCLQYFGWAMAPVLYSWQGDICRRNQQKRSIILVFMNCLAQTTTAFMAVIVWKTVEAPRFLKGYTFTACSGFALCIWTFVVLYFYKKDERKYAIDNGIYLYNSSNPEDIPEHVRAQTEKESKQESTKGSDHEGGSEVETESN